jgi:DNA topoisomerase-1
MTKDGNKSGKHLVVVESPAKAKTIGRYLGPDYDVAASIGHVRDLPKDELAVDVEQGFEPRYVTIPGKANVLAELKRKSKNVDDVILATDPDREGEAIAFHVADHLGLAKSPERFRRVEFREITKSAVERALAAPGTLDMRKVEAQQARRVLDRLVGYEVSPFLWTPIRPGLSAGRVQTVALRLVCEREDEIRRFVSEEYWSVVAHLDKDGQPFEAKLHKIDGRAFTLKNGASAQGVLSDIDGLPFLATDVKRRERQKNPPAPFTTSTLQQEAAKRLGFSAKRTMSAAQKLYEGVEVGNRGAVGLITYMRTDSTRVSAEAAAGARQWVESQFGARYLPDHARPWAGLQQKGAQEAHEAIRPTDPFLLPEEARAFLSDSDARLYELIWLRFVAGQMASGVYDTTTADFDLAGRDHRYQFRATGSVVKFDGFTRLYQEAVEAGDHRTLGDLEPLPDIVAGDTARLLRMEPKQHFTQPPPRFSEASLVKELEKRGIGRPSTYAETLSKIQERGYADLVEKRFVPTPLGDTVAKLLVRVFPDLFDPDFTSRMEGELDRVEEGEVDWREVLGEFYPGFKTRLEEGKAASDDIVREILAADGEFCEKCGSPMIVKWNRFGRFLGCSRYPECESTRPLDGAQGREASVLGTDPGTGLEVHLRDGPYGPYVQLGNGAEAGGDGGAAGGKRGKAKDEGAKKDRDAKKARPKRVSIPRGRDPASVDLDYALQLLSLPRTVGTDPGTGKNVTAGLGRYGPYVERGGVYRNLRDPERVFTVTMEEALDLLAQESGPAVLKDFGAHPNTGKPLRILEGRYGPYVTDGEVNASLRKGSDPDATTLEEALGLLAEAAARGKGKRRGARGMGRGKGGATGGRKGANKGGAKRGTAKRGSKKATSGGPKRAPRKTKPEASDDG